MLINLRTAGPVIYYKIVISIIWLFQRVEFKKMDFCGVSLYKSLREDGRGEGAQRPILHVREP
jgi:hypothetical protein